MITKNTVFILGAGASAPYGYPVGIGLRDDICLNFAQDIETLLRKSNTEYSYLMDLLELIPDFVQAFRMSRNKSIDRWLSVNPRYKEIGKLAIANSIVKHENQANLLFEGKDKAPDWFTVLFNEMIAGSSLPEHFMMQKGGFITFNYDRVLEYLFYDSFKNTYSGLPDHEVSRILSSLGTSIIHVYGTIDDPPWEKGRSTYAKDYNLTYLSKARNGIRIINERTNDSGTAAMEWRHFRDIIFADVDSIFFLGFGYDPENLRILDIPNYPDGHKPAIYGTAHGLLAEEIAQARNRVLRGDPCLVEPCDCTTLLRKYLHRVMI
jgi:hypothetical protein